MARPPFPSCECRAGPEQHVYCAALGWQGSRAWAQPRQIPCSDSDSSQGRLLRDACTPGPPGVAGRRQCRLPGRILAPQAPAAAPERHGHHARVGAPAHGERERARAGLHARGLGPAAIRQHHHECVCACLGVLGFWPGGDGLPRHGPPRFRLPCTLRVDCLLACQPVAAVQRTETWGSPPRPPPRPQPRSSCAGAGRGSLAFGCAGWPTTRSCAGCTGARPSRACATPRRLGRRGQPRLVRRRGPAPGAR